MTELLVVIAIIVLLIGLLLVALKQVQIKAKRTRTEALMQQFANACASFQSEFGRYPGIIPEDVLLTTPLLSSTENAMLELMGGFRVKAPTDDPSGVNATAYATYLAQANLTNSAVQMTFPSPSGDWHLLIDKRKIGEGPIINGKLHPSYFTPGAQDLAVVQGQVFPNNGTDPGIVDLIDAWGQPIIYIRQSRSRGPLVLDPAANTPQPQYLLAGVRSYVQSGGLGEFGMNQNQGPNRQGSILTVGNADDQNKVFAAILSHPSFYKSSAPLYGAARGAIVLISAGSDGIFFSSVDGPGSQTDPIDTPAELNSKIINVGPKVIDEFNDIRVYSGG